MSDRATVIGVIPARYASQRLPAKPLADLLGKPMIRRVYEQAKRAALLDRVIVATDDERIADVVSQFGGEAVLTSRDIKSGSDRVAAVALNVPGDLFVNIQGDEPLLPPDMVDQAVRMMLEDPKTPLGTLAAKVTHAADLTNPNVVKVVMGEDGHALYFSRSPIPHVRDEPDASAWLRHHTFYKHIGLYVFRREFLMNYSRLPETTLERAERLEQLRALELGFPIRVGITPYESIPVDTPEDVRRVVEILQRQHS